MRFLFNKIAADSRHVGCEILHERWLPQRTYKSFGMSIGKHGTRLKVIDGRIVAFIGLLRPLVIAVRLSCRCVTQARDHSRAECITPFFCSPDVFVPLKKGSRSRDTSQIQAPHERSFLSNENLVRLKYSSTVVAQPGMQRAQQASVLVVQR